VGLSVLAFGMFGVASAAGMSGAGFTLVLVGVMVVGLTSGALAVIAFERRERSLLLLVPALAGLLGLAPLLDGVVHLVHYLIFGGE